ncbi:HAUS augmin-like complex subunit 6 N-terminus-domain-containing protein [Phascolomyces articulosus]|uniref:HAUS augmin-like complex subunit 6 N-terminus-domain-containing protein n=1 Tax=Phascolomyces articulosus TaxID=60185 RepID=A0AAD5PHZ4_9FUNG|nr:HAUS augmin-like complex subunit 6 N-terminus-domain-containing protein [Phascolomyces articulosus]
MDTTTSSGNNVATLFLTNLQLLGFVPEKFTTGIFSKIVFDEHMFSYANNNKAFEATSHFLFLKLDPSRTKTEFSKCWPMTETDYRRQSREYRTIAYRWLDELRIKQCLLGRVTLRKSYFEDCRGEKLNAIMLAFSTYVLQKVVDRRFAMKGNQEDIKPAPVRILETTSINLPPKETLIKTLQSEIGRMASAMAQDNQIMHSCNETWARMARKMASLNDHNITSFSSPNPESKRYKNKSQWNGMHSILQTLNSNLDKLNRENRKLRLASAQKEEQLRKMNRSTDSLHNVFNALKGLFPVEKNPIVDDIPPLALPVGSTKERKKRIQKYVDELVASHNIKKRQHEMETKNENNRSKRQKASLSAQVPISPTHKKTVPQLPSLPPSPLRATQPSPARYTPAHSSPLTRRVSTVSNATRGPPPSATPRTHTLGSPFSYISEKVSPLSTTYPDYCENIVNQVMENFQEQRTPDNMGILSPIENRSIHSGRLSVSSQSKNWPTPSPFSQKVAASLSHNEDSPTASPSKNYIIKGRKTDTPLSTLWDYYENNNKLDNVYQNSPTRRSIRSSPVVSGHSQSSPGLYKTTSSSVAASPAASSLHAYRAAMDEQNTGAELLDETEPDMFYTSDFTIQT